MGMIYQFEHFQLDCAKLELRRDDEAVHIEPQTFALLRFIVEHRDRVVSKAELINGIWSGRVVSDWAVAAAIKAARISLGDSESPRRFIKTIHGKGVRFIADVSSDAENSTAAKSKPLNPTSLIIMPLMDLSEGQKQQYLADGITDDLINDLSRSDKLKVASRNASYQLHKQRHEPKRLLQKFNITHMLEGSLRIQNDRFRVNFQLLDTCSEEQIWSERFDGKLDDIFEFQDEICAKIARQLHIQLAVMNKQRGTRNQLAYEHFQRGKAEYHLYKPPNLAAALSHFEAATKVDPDYAEAFAYQSYCRTSNYVFAWPGSDPDLEEALELAQHAINLDDQSAISHSRLGWVLAFLSRADETIAAFDRALELEPTNAEAWHSYGESLNRLATPEKALQYLDNAFKIESFVPPAWDFARGHSRILLRDYEKALSHILPVLERVPGFVPARVQLTRAYAEMGQMEEAKRTAQSILKFAPKYTMKNALRMFPYPVMSEFDRFQSALQASEFPQG